MRKELYLFSRFYYIITVIIQNPIRKTVANAT